MAALINPEWLNEPELVIDEDFDWGSKDSATVVVGSVTSGFGNSDLVRPGWSFQSFSNAGTANHQAGVVNHKGVWFLTTNTIAASRIAMAYGETAMAGTGFDIANVIMLRWVILVVAGANQSLNIGLADDWTNLTGTRIVVQYAPATSANWLVFSVDAGLASSTTTTSVAVTTAAWHVVTLVQQKQPSAAWLIYVDGVLIATKTANIPVSGQQLPGISQQIVTVGGTRTVQIDDCKLWVSGQQLLRT